MVSQNRDARVAATRWLGEALQHTSVLATLLREHEEQRGQLEAARLQGERLVELGHENEQLRGRLAAEQRESDLRRAEVLELRAEIERLVRDREEVADQLTRIMNAVLARLRPASIDAPPAGLESLEESGRRRSA